MTSEARQWRNTLRWSTNGDFFQTFDPQMATSSRLLVNNGLYTQETSVATLCRVLPCQRLNLISIISYPRKLAECLYCDVTPPPILPVLSRFIEFTCHMQLYSRTVIYSLYNHTNHIHTLILSHINAYTSYTPHHSHMIALVIQSLVSPYVFSSVFTYHCWNKGVSQVTY